MKVSNSKLRAFNRCKRAYHYKFVRNLTSALTPSPLKRGLWIHDLLEAYHTTGDWKAKHREYMVEWNRLFDEEKDHYGNLPDIIERMMNSYVYYWREEDKTMTYIATEDECAVELGPHTLVFRFDGIAEDSMGRWLVEHKTHATIPKSDYRFLDTQSSLYVYGLNKLGTYGEITGVMWNYLRAKPPTIPQLLKNGTLSKRKIDTDVYTFVKAVKGYGLDPRDYRDVISRLKNTSSSYFKRERVPKAPQVVKTVVAEAIYTASEIERGYEPVRTIERTCDWCSFRDLCVVELYGGNAAQLEKLKYRTRTVGEYYADDFEETAATT